MKIGEKVGFKMEQLDKFLFQSNNIWLFDFPIL